MKRPIKEKSKKKKRSKNKLNNTGGLKHNGNYQYGRTCQPEGKKHMKRRKVRKFSFLINTIQDAAKELYSGSRTTTNEEAESLYKSFLKQLKDKPTRPNRL